jgi:photosystem II stability/assembly factor-like uncharacterized protein
MKLHLRILFGSLSVVALFLIACPTSDENGRQTLNMRIDKDNDSLLTFDSLIVTVHSKDGKFSQDVFHGVLRNPSQVQAMPLDPRVGEDYTITIVGYKGGKIGVNKEVTFIGDGSQSKDIPIKTDKPETVVVAPNLPELLVPSDTNITEGDSLRFRVSVKNPWTGVTTLTLKDAIPGATLDTVGRDPGDGYFTWQPSFEQGRAEPYAVTFAYASKIQMVEKITRVRVANLNRSPRLSAIPDQKVKENEVLTFKIEATDPDRDSLTLTAQGLPIGAAFSAGAFTWRPAEGQTGNYTVKFLAFDGADSDWVSVLITVGNVDEPLPITVEITSPAHDTMINYTPITIFYTVNGTPLQKKFDLKDGKNRIRIDTTVQNRTGFDTLLITLDTVPPAAPNVSGASPIRTRTPVWSWKSGGNGSGIYRYRLDSDDMSGSTPLALTAYTASKDLDEGPHILYVQERDTAGNWSASGKHVVRVDTTRPVPPSVRVSPTSPTNNPLPTWSWTSADDDLSGLYRYRLDTNDFSTGAIEFKTSSFMPDKALKEGAHTLYVQIQDSAGNWSKSGAQSIAIDLTPPAAPKISTMAAKTTNTKPTWTWKSDENGEAKFYRYRVDDADMTTAVLTTDSAYSPSNPLSEGTHSIYVQERDSAGNWSAKGTLAITIFGRTGYAVGGYSGHTGGSVIVRTTDAGATWEALTSITNLSLNAISFCDTKTAYAAGLTGVFKTVDGGSTWKPSSADISRYLFGAYFINANIGYVVGNAGSIFQTVNGGGIWKQAAAHTTEDLKAVSFANTNTGYAIGSYGTIRGTQDAGNTWDSVDSHTNALLTAIHFPDTLTGYIAGWNGIILRTSDGGKSWEFPGSGLPKDLFAIFFTRPDTGFAAGLGGFLAKTANGGKSWTTLASGTVENIRSIYFTDVQTGYIVGDNGAMMKTINGGEKWEPMPSPTTYSLNAIQFP